MAGIMSKLKSNPSAEINPIEQFFEVGKESSNVGTCLIWRVYDAYRRSDGKECSVFVFDKRIAEKLYKPKRKESMLDRIKYSVTALERLRSPRMLQIVHSIEEASHTVAFASEPIIGCLHNILSFHESSVAPGAPPPVMPHPITLGPPGIQAQQMQIPAIRPKFAKEYYFLDIEIRYGILQIIEALQYMHYSAHLIHRNVCPQTIIVTKKGTWKLFGLEYVEPVRARALPTPPPRSNLPVQFTSMIPPPMKPSPLAEKPVVPGAKRLDGPPDEATLAKNDSIEMVAVPPWSIKVARLVQPNLDFMAPECQTNGQVCVLSDMFSLGLVICAIFNNGKSLIQANNNPLLYLKQIEYLDHQVGLLMERIPTALQEAVQRLLIKDPHPRPTSQLLPLIKYFKGPCEQTIATMQFLDIVLVKEPGTKGQFYRGQLMDALPYIPKKLRWQHVWPVVQLELRTVEMLSSALLPAIWLCNDASHEEFTTLMLPTVKSVMHTPKNIQSTVTILENLHIFLKKCTKADVTNEMMQMLYTALDNTASPVQFELQTSSLIALQNISELMDDRILHNIILPKVRLLLETNQSDVKVICLILGFFEKVLLRLERGHILEQVIPTLLKMRLSDPDIINRVVKLYKSMLMEKKFGLTSNVMATKMIPALAPQTINPALNVDQFTNLMEILYDMLDNIDQTQRAKLKLDHLGLGSPERHRLRYQMSSDNMNAPPFNIPNLRVEKRKTSSAEDMARKNSISGPPPTGSVGGFKSTGLGQWFFGSSNSTNNDGNFLRVVSAFPGRRLSDNTLMTPKIRVAPSCASSPGGTPGGTSGLPTRRHSSIGPQERRCSNVNLSPPTGYQYKGRTAGSGSSLSVPAGSQCAGGSMPNTSSSVPFLLTSSMQSIRSRRPSACSQGSGILQQLSSGVYQLFSGRT